MSMAQFVLSISIVNFEHVIADCALKYFKFPFQTNCFSYFSHYWFNDHEKC